MRTKENLHVPGCLLCWANLSRSLGLLSQDFLLGIVEESLGMLPETKCTLADLKGGISVFRRAEAPRMLFLGQLFSGPHIARGPDLASSFLKHLKSFSPLSQRLHHRCWGTRSMGSAGGKVEGRQCLSVHLPLTFLYELAGAASAILGSGFLSFASLAGVVQPGSVKDFMFCGANKCLGIFLSLSHPCGL